MMSGWDHSHHVNSRPPEDGVVGGLDIKDTKLCDDVERVRANWELDRAWRTGFSPIKIVEE